MLTNDLITEAFDKVINEEYYDNMGTTIVGNIKVRMYERIRTVRNNYNDVSAAANYLKFMMLTALMNGIGRSMARDNERRQPAISRKYDNITIEQVNEIADKLITPVLNTIQELPEDQIINQVINGQVRDDRVSSRVE